MLLYHSSPKYPHIPKKKATPRGAVFFFIPRGKRKKHSFLLVGKTKIPYLCGKTFITTTLNINFMGKKRRFQWAAAAFALALCPSAMNAQQMVVQTEGGNDTYKLSDIRKILTSAEGLTVGENGKEAKEYSYPKIRKIVFDTSTAIAAVKATTADFAAKVEEDGKAITWTGLEGPQEVALFDISGKMLRHATHQTLPRMDISGLPQGTYILKVGNHNFKFIK